jgi:hypothetical protein
VQVALTATVVGPDGEEIWVDEKGQIKVQFHWDREGKYDENSSCWIRTMQPWGGRRLGAPVHPAGGDGGARTEQVPAVHDHLAPLIGLIMVAQPRSGRAIQKPK